MGLGQSLSLSHTLSQTQKLSLTHALEQRLAHAQKTADLVEDLRDKLPNPPRENLQAAIQTVIQSIRGPELRSGLEHMFSNPVFLSVLERKYDQLTVPSRTWKVEAFIVDYLYEATGGSFALVENGRSESLPTTVRPGRMLLDQALRNPKKVQADIAEYTSIARQYAQAGQDVRGLMQEMDDRRDAMSVAEVLRAGILDNNVMLLRLALAVRSENGRPGLLDHLRETALLSRFTPLASDRLMNRFVDRCRNLLDKGEGEFREAFLNTIGEYVLLSLGIIEPEVFKLNRAVLSQDEFRYANELFKDLGFDLQERLQYYKLQGPGTIFSQRYAVKACRPCTVTDALIRCFLTTTVRQDGERVLAAAQYDRFFYSLTEVKNERYGVGYREALSDLLSEPAFRDELMDLIKERWFKELAVFFPERKQS